MDYLTLENISQAGLSIFGVLSIILVSCKNKWGFVLGLLSQPFWFMAIYLNYRDHNQFQWGIMTLCIIYTGSWINGIYVWFKKPDPKKGLK